MQLSTANLALLTIIIIWDMVWKALALWKSARNGQTAWFVANLILNTAGLLPIIYIYFFQKKHKS